MNGKMRAGLSLLLCLVLCLGTAGAAESRDLTSQEGQAMRLERLGLFLGVGEDENGFTDFDLDRTPSREEAVTMLVQALGKGTEAAEMGKTHPFTDVPAWADGYVSYAYDQGLTKGTSDTTFGAGDTATGAMYVTFMLRALGYADGTDFTWDDPWALAETCGILPDRGDLEDFLRADAVEVTAAALSAKLKGTDATMAQKLITEGAVSQAAYDQAFQNYEAAMAGIAANDFYREEERWESDYGTVVLGLVSGLPSGNGYTLQMVTKPAAAVGEGLIIDLPLPNKVAPEEPALSADGQTFTYSIHLEETVTVSSKTDLEGVTYQAGTYTYMVDLRSGKVTRDIRPTEVTTEAEQAAYDAAIAQRIQGVTVLERLESDYCTVLYTSAASDSRGEFRSLTLVYKPGSPRTAGETLGLELPMASDTTQAVPEGMAFRDDGDVFSYTCTVDGSAESWEAGTYRFTVHLHDGGVEMEFVP
ncbi:S-layer homology domain-containing protein [Intestinimonas timonensis]|uniref:S-layer homology domain-containing protein n=1 Tax=Intestinimonas timonensis TaxID=1689270 RepID=UPI001030C065|nr:S-layer homology domain-containing protein [Intestinimonas timonensis]